MIEGIKTTIPFQDVIIKSSDFKSGNLQHRLGSQQVLAMQPHQPKK